MAVNAIEMSVQDWFGVADNPRQRDTAKRAKHASRKHLRKYSKVHRFVYAAAKHGAVLCKLDGHTRAFLWQSGELETPPDGKVTVCLIEVSSLAEAKVIYDQLDSQPSVKKPSDAIYGACRENGVKLNSHLLRSCTFATQLKLATSGNRFSGDVYAMVKDWKSELVQLDALGLTSNYTILISVMLFAVRRDGIDKAGKFFSALDKGEGLKTPAGYDGVQLLHEVIAVRRSEGRTAGWENLAAICGQAWSAYEFYNAGKCRKNASLPIANFTALVNTKV